MNPIPRQMFAAVLFCLLAFFAATASAAPKAEWRIVAREDAEGNPRSKVDLVINGKQVVHVVPTEVTMRYEVLRREDYAGHHVPARAICACTSWWAGGGTNYYVVPSGEGRLVLYRQDLDEETPVQRYEKDRTIKIDPP